MEQGTYIKPKFTMRAAEGAMLETRRQAASITRTTLDLKGLEKLQVAIQKLMDSKQGLLNSACLTDEEQCIIREQQIATETMESLQRAFDVTSDKLRGEISVQKKILAQNRLAPAVQSFVARGDSSSIPAWKQSLLEKKRAEAAGKAISSKPTGGVAVKKHMFMKTNPALQAKSKLARSHANATFTSRLGAEPFRILKLEQLLDMLREACDSHDGTFDKELLDDDCKELLDELRPATMEPVGSFFKRFQVLKLIQYITQELKET
jgi:hypothetical protein